MKSLWLLVLLIFVGSHAAATAATFTAVIAPLGKAERSNLISTAIGDLDDGTAKFRTASGDYFGNYLDDTLVEGVASVNLAYSLTNTSSDVLVLPEGSVTVAFDGIFETNSLPGLLGTVHDFFFSARMIVGGGGFGQGVSIRHAPTNLLGFETGTFVAPTVTMMQNDAAGYAGVYSSPEISIGSGEEFIFDFVVGANVFALFEGSTLPDGYEDAVVVDALGTASLSLTLPSNVSVSAPSGPVPSFVVTTDPSPIPLPASAWFLIFGLAGLRVCSFRSMRGTSTSSQA